MTIWLYNYNLFPTSLPWIDNTRLFKKKKTGCSENTTQEHVLRNWALLICATCSSDVQRESNLLVSTEKYIIWNPFGIYKTSTFTEKGFLVKHSFFYVAFNDWIDWLSNANQFNVACSGTYFNSILSFQ